MGNCPPEKAACLVGLALKIQQKKVYVLGAGFSHEGGLPLQREILDRLRQFNVERANAPEAALNEFRRSRATLFDFLDRVFSSARSPSLEDVFTLLDYTISRREYCAGHPWTELEQIRSALNIALVFLFCHATNNLARRSEALYRSIAAYFLQERLKAGQAGDPFSIIALNWDTLLENSICWCLREVGGLRKVDIDYCCYTTPLDGSSPHTPSILQKARGLFNLKLIKLHGSANWLVCPNCNRLYTGIGGNEEREHVYSMPQYCARCIPVRSPGMIGVGPISPRLGPFLITPTYLKVFDSPHIQMTWHNAYVDLAEASEVVFIGYSFPEADYHFRTLLRRAIRSDTDIVAVLVDTDEPKRNVPRIIRSAYAAVRYRLFFGEDRVMFKFGGTKAFLTGLGGRTRLPDCLQYVRARLRHHKTKELR